MTFRRYAGRTVADVAEDDQGLLFLDWLHHQRPLGIAVRYALATALQEHAGRLDHLRATVVLDLDERP